MDVWGVLLTVGVPVLTIAVAVWATRRWGTRRAKVRVSWTSVPLLQDQARGGLLEVLYKDVVVDDPHLTTISVRNVGDPAT